jgi:hypothetical protein
MIPYNISQPDLLYAAYRSAAISVVGFKNISDNQHRVGELLI